MKHLLTLGLITSLLIFSTQSGAQEVKMKSKPGKTKVKGASATDAATAPNAVSVAATADAGMSAMDMSLKNTTWKGYIGDPLNDTLIWKFGIDTVLAQSRTGDTFVTTNFSTVQDTLTISDVSGEYSCPNETARYKFAITGDTMSLTLIEDNCQGRAAALNGTKWQRVNGPAGQ